MRGLYVYVIEPWQTSCLELWQTFKQTRLSKHSYKKNSAANDWDFKMSKRNNFSIIKKIFRLRNIPCIIRNPRDLKSLLPKMLYCRLETIAYKGTGLWQQLPAKTKKSSSLVTFMQNIKLWKDPKCSFQICKIYTGRMGFI